MIPNMTKTNNNTYRKRRLYFRQSRNMDHSFINYRKTISVIALSNTLI